jgi:flagellar motor switch protein FliN/FliY
MNAEPQHSLAAELANHLGGAIEGMTGEQPKVSLGNEVPSTTAPNAVWRQKFTPCSGAAWLVAASATWIAIGTRVLLAAGIEESDAETSKSTFVEILGQAFSMLARSISAQTKIEWSCSEGSEITEAPPALSSGWISLQLTFPDGVSDSVFVGFDDAVLKDVAPQPPAPAPPPAAPVEVASAIIQSARAAPLSREQSRILDVLLDVELPVTVSFGHAQLPLKDVIKLTTGSIVELNRSISEPVEIIVNNCVIARGEVVVVEGNFGVRIQHVVSKEERLRTLY